ncbi:MAG TPA: trimethylamine methyltransferase, partial [Acidimicrobiaceae bacterium]|nr:trimethylamine methyltransferase [Acidimicrobiaceae bacterium]
MNGERRRGGRSARTASRATFGAGVVGDAGGQPRRRIPTYELLDEASLVRLEAHADWILDEIGVEIRGDEEACELFRDAGARVDGERIRFDAGLVRSLCASAPSEFAMHGRDDRHTVTVGGDSVVFSPVWFS